MPKKRSVKRHSVTQPSDTSYRLIPLTQGQNAIVDAEDFHRISKYHWLATKVRDGNFYAKRLRYSDKRWIHMANAIIHRRPGNLVDFIKHHCAYRFSFSYISIIEKRTFGQRHGPKT